MKVVVVHESYQQPGGEDRAMDADVRLLRSRGHEVVEYRRHNREVEDYSRLKLGLATIWSRAAHRDLFTLVSQERPDIVHFHNTLPLISPSGLWAARRAGSRVVQTLHNYRLACPNALFFRRGSVCEDCLRWQIPIPAVVHGCYRGSRTATLAVGSMLAVHRLIGTWRRAVDRFIVLTEFQKARLLRVGLPEGRVAVRPNFVSPDPGKGSANGAYALFVGRLTREKGVLTLLHAWQELHERIPLRIVGAGPLAGEVQRAAQENVLLSYLGPTSHDKVLGLMHGASCLVFPSEWYEGLPMTIVEAFAVGLPVVAAARGAAGEVVVDGRTGFHFRSGDSRDLADAVSRLVRNNVRRGSMQAICRREYLEKYSAEGAYLRLMEIYQEALEVAPFSGSP